MFITHRLDRHVRNEDTGAALLGVLLFLWLTLGALLLVVVVSGHQPDAWPHRLDNLLPADPALWSGFSA